MHRTVRAKNGFLLLLSRLNSLSKVTRCFSSGFLCSFLCLLQAHERKERSANLSTALLRLFFLNGYSSRPYFGGRGESPIYFIIGQGTVNASTHNQPTILQDFFRASSLLSATTLNTPSKTYCVYTKKSLFLHHL